MNLWKVTALCSIAALVGVVGFSSRDGVGVQSASAGGPCHDQPNMASAQEHLRQARRSLDSAEHNKGGWRVAAITATDNALREATRGCEFADGK